MNRISLTELSQLFENTALTAEEQGELIKLFEEKDKNETFGPNDLAIDPREFQALRFDGDYDALLIAIEERDKNFNPVNFTKLVSSLWDPYFPTSSASLDWKEAKFSRQEQLIEEGYVNTTPVFLVGEKIQSVFIVERFHDDFENVVPNQIMLRVDSTVANEGDEDSFTLNVEPEKYEELLTYIGMPVRAEIQITDNFQDGSFFANYYVLLSNKSPTILSRFCINVKVSWAGI